MKYRYAVEMLRLLRSTGNLHHPQQLLLAMSFAGGPAAILTPPEPNVAPRGTLSSSVFFENEFAQRLAGGTGREDAQGFGQKRGGERKRGLAIDSSAMLDEGPHIQGSPRWARTLDILVWNGSMR